MVNFARLSPLNIVLIVIAIFFVWKISQGNKESFGRKAHQQSVIDDLLVRVQDLLSSGQNFDVSALWNGKEKIIVVDYNPKTGGNFLTIVEDQQARDMFEQEIDDRRVIDQIHKFVMGGPGITLSNLSLNYRGNSRGTPEVEEEVEEVEGEEGEEGEEEVGEEEPDRGEYEYEVEGDR